jgi:hypothetical protein
MIIMDEGTLWLTFALGIIAGVGFMVMGYGLLIWSYHQQFKQYLSQTEAGYHEFVNTELSSITEKLEKLACGTNTRLMKFKYHDFLELMHHLKRRYMNT